MGLRLQAAWRGGSPRPEAVGFGVFVVMVVCLAFGCQAPQAAPASPDLPHLPERVETDEPIPSYADLAQRYNRNIEKLDRLWSRAVVAMRWRDEDGKRHHEQGEGHFIFTRPSNVALTVGKLGDVMMWAGSSDERYWMFDLRDAGKAYVGAHEHVGKPCSEPLPLPVYPRAVVHLLGLLPLDESLAGAAPEVEMLRGYYLVDPPGLKLRMLLHPKTALPVRVDLTDREGRTVVIAMLSEHEYVEQAGKALNAGPKIATRAKLYAVGEDAELSLHLGDLTDGRRFDKINEKVFEFDALAQIHEPAEVVELDGACE